MTKGGRKSLAYLKKNKKLLLYKDAGTQLQVQFVSIIFADNQTPLDLMYKPHQRPQQIRNTLNKINRKQFHNMHI